MTFDTAVHENISNYLFFFFLNDPATPETYPLPLHDALPISSDKAVAAVAGLREKDRARSAAASRKPAAGPRPALAHARINDSARPAEGRVALGKPADKRPLDRKSTRLNSSHGYISYAVFCLK